MKKLSVVLAVRNEEENIARCLESVKDIADEIIVFDEYSTDKTAEIAKKFGAKVFEEPHHEIFHVTKEKALEKATGEWVLQLDADERVTPELATQIKQVILGDFSAKTPELFLRHQKIVEERDGKIGSDSGEIVAYFVPRRNLFLGKVLIHGGVYPDGVIRLFKNNKAHFPARSVHEQIVVNGKVGWLTADLLHEDSPTFSRYLDRFNRYTDLKSQELQNSKTPKNILTLLKYSTILPGYYFLLRYIRFKGFMDGMRGFVWSLFSALHYPIAYFKYYANS